MIREHTFVPETQRRTSDSRLLLGRRGEALVRDHFRALGFTPIAHNHRTRYGEIDLVAFDGDTLAFVEVKTRRIRARRLATPNMRNPPSAIRRYGEQTLGWPATRQRRRLRRLALAWLHNCGRTRPSARNIRFDVVRVLIGEDDQPLRIEHVEAAC
jgi:putative endonuclease